MNTDRRMTSLALCIFLATMGLAPRLLAQGTAAQPTKRADRPQVVLLGYCDDQQIDESSGIAASTLRDGLLWTHNDSGDKPRLFAIDYRGRRLGVVKIRGATADDWEDMGSFRDLGTSYLFVADVGDNQRRRAQCAIYVLPEPAKPSQDTSIDQVETIKFRYADGPRDCEAVAFDPRDRQFLLIDKPAASPADGQPAQHAVYRLPWSGFHAGERPLKIAKRIATVSLPPAVSPTNSASISSASTKLLGRFANRALSAATRVTAMDISQDGQRLMAVTYLGGYEFSRKDGEPWTSALARSPHILGLPVRVQGEAVCYGPNGRDLFLSSEKRPWPVYQIRREAKDPPDAIPF